MSREPDFRLVCSGPAMYASRPRHPSPRGSHLRLVHSSELWNASDDVQPRGEPPMAASAQVKTAFDGPEDRQLADDIARVMHHRPLMSRLARVESAHGEAAGFVAKSATRVAHHVPAPAT